MFIRQNTLLHFAQIRCIESYVYMKFYDKHPILDQYPKFPVKVQPIQVANYQVMTVKEAIKFLISFGSHTFEIIVYLFPFSDTFDLIFGLKNMTEVERLSNCTKLKFNF